ncbi:hypothetical protein Dxin01_01186 [Deinococcus xinjiangensis]|uniref:Uncharacterized protein n=1 Tax=Deinococcus xinjiangensis TaxID=457454 RepID=A0ABP9V861_9DEIO
MNPHLQRQLISLAGLAIGVGLYFLSSKLPGIWQHVAVGGLFVALGVAAWVYAAGERWIQVLAAVLILWGVLRAFLIH